MRVAVLSATALATLWLWSGQAQAGGGCHAGVTEGTGDTIRLVDACFTPTILRVDPGATVTFVNKDPFAHNVTANGWGHFDNLDPEDSFTASFQAAGTYPFACTIHPGMSGAIVVGDGIATGAHIAVTTGTLADGGGTQVAAATSGAGTREQDPRGGARTRSRPRGGTLLRSAAPPVGGHVAGVARSVDVSLGQTVAVMPACCIASWKSCWFDTDFIAASSVTRPSFRRVSSHWSNVHIP
jgi:plastocyanin